MIEVKGLVKSFDGFEALSSATLTVPTGSVYGLVGPNGAGKTTLIKHLTGVYRQDKGIVSYDGDLIWENAALKDRVIYIPDSLYFPLGTISDMRVFYKNTYSSFSDERFEKLKDLFGFDLKKPLRTFSKGQTRQIAFWLALSCMPEYLILDEPMDGLDPVMRHQVWSLLMSEVEKRNLTILVSSHNLRELEDVCDMVAIMNKGSVLIERSLEELQDNMTKMQVVFREDAEEALKEIPAVHVSNIGRVYTIILRMPPKEARAVLGKYNPVIADALPLTLEEIFIYELGGAYDGIDEILE
ncbi:MAG: ABC transporter ATP-binding protein [Eubacterium sp.]|nr:ABC transporter ATP-binding protein [Eubacterium sp.]